MIDRRLARRAQAVRVLLAVDAALGIGAALLVLAQAVLLARIAARGFDGAGLEELTLPLVLLVAAVAGRAVAAWGFETAGRRAAADVLSELRLDLVERRLRDSAVRARRHGQRRGGDGCGRRRRRARDDLRAATCPRSRWRSSSRSRCSRSSCPSIPSRAGVMLLTLAARAGVHVADRPVHGAANARAVGRRWPSSRRTSWTWSAGLPTLRAFNRGEAQMRVGSPRSSDELPAGDDGDAAGRVPLRGGPRARGDARDRARGGDRGRSPRRRAASSFEAGADRARARARAVPAAAERRPRSSTRAPTGSRSRSGCCDLLERSTPAVRSGTGIAPSPRCGAGPARARRRTRTRRGSATCSRRSTSSSARGRRSHWSGRAERQEHGRGPAPRPRRADAPGG